MRVLDRDAPFEAPVIAFAERLVLILCLGLLLALDGETPFSSSTTTSFSSRLGNSAIILTSLSVSPDVDVWPAHRAMKELVSAERRQVETAKDIIKEALISWCKVRNG